MVRTRSKTAPRDVLSLSYSWSSHKRERQNTLRVVFSNAAQVKVAGKLSYVVRSDVSAYKTGMPSEKCADMRVPYAIYHALATNVKYILIPCKYSRFFI